MFQIEPKARPLSPKEGEGPQPELSDGRLLLENEVRNAVKTARTDEQNFEAEALPGYTGARIAKVTHLRALAASTATISCPWRSDRLRRWWERHALSILQQHRLVLIWDGRVHDWAVLVPLNERLQA